MKKIVVNPDLPFVVVLVESNTFFYAHDVEKFCKGTVLITENHDRSETVVSALQEVINSLKKKQSKGSLTVRLFKILLKTLRRYR